MDWKRILIVFLGVFILLQFIPRRGVTIEVNPAEDFNPERSTAELALLRAACYDCHSHETEYPWYYAVQPVALWMDRHVEEAREELNFSIWHVMSLSEQADRLEECAEVVAEEEMPLPSFTWTHPEARLSADERQLLVDWFQRLRAEY